MQLFSDVIVNILSLLESYSLKINKIIKSDNSDYYPDEINNLYFERGKIIEEFLECKRSNEWDVYLIDNNIYCSEFIDRIKKIEDENISLINDHIKDISDQIKNLMKQKSLLIYMKT
jgi:hypothetical protein